MVYKFIDRKLPGDAVTHALSKTLDTQDKSDIDNKISRRITQIKY